MSDNYKSFEKADKLIENVCKYYQIDRNYLNKNNRYKPPKMFISYNNGYKVKISLSSIRMALSFFLLKYTDIPTEKLGPMVGYSDHTSVSYNKNKIINYLEYKDKVFMPYWNTVVMLANDLEFDLSMERVLTNYRIIMQPSKKIYQQNLEM